MSGIYENFGLRLPYPENWTVEDGHNSEWPESVVLQSPGSGFWSLSIHPTDSDGSELAAQVLNTLRQEYEEIEAESVRDKVGEVDASGFDLNFYCLDFVISGSLRVFRDSRRLYLTLYQAESREFENLSPIFRLLSACILNPDLANKAS
jgi:hypothetical protein